MICIRKPKLCVSTHCTPAGDTWQPCVRMAERQCCGQRYSDVIWVFLLPFSPSARIWGGCLEWQRASPFIPAFVPACIVLMWREIRTLEGEICDGVCVGGREGGWKGRAGRDWGRNLKEGEGGGGGDGGSVSMCVCVCVLPSYLPAEWLVGWLGWKKKKDWGTTVSLLPGSLTYLRARYSSAVLPTWGFAIRTCVCMCVYVARLIVRIRERVLYQCHTRVVLWRVLWILGLGTIVFDAWKNDLYNTVIDVLVFVYNSGNEWVWTT